jgi:hypothetical protein
VGDNVSYQSNLSDVMAKLRAARFAGLVAAAQVVINAVKESLRGGYTSGAFVTGFVLNSVNRSEPSEDAQGAFILVGTNVNYALFWEVGHMNVFTRKFERQERWMPAFLKTRQQQADAYLRAFTRVWGTGGGGSGRVAASPRSPR